MTQASAIAVAPACLRLLGGWQLIVDGLVADVGHREQRLIAVLGLTDLASRSQVASTLWPDSTDEHALGSLRRSVRQCRTRCPGVLVADRLTVALDPSVRVDVDDLHRAAGLTRLPMTDEVARELLGVLVGPELLPGWFDDRVVEERALLEQLRVEALERIAQDALERGALELARDAATSASLREPLRETARELVIRSHLGRGDVATAFNELQRYGAVMGEELGLAPPARIRALLEPLVAEDQRVPDAVPRRRAARVEVPVEEPVPDRDPIMGVDEWIERGRPTGGVRRVLAAVLAAAVLALGLALAVAITAPHPEGPATTDPGEGGGLVELGDPGSAAGPPPARTVRVRLVDASAGSAAFAVRATPLPAEVTLVVHGPGGLRVVRTVVVRAIDGRRVRVDGLGVGTYRWSATSASAVRVTGELLVGRAPEVADARDDVPSSAAATVVPVVETASETATALPSPSPTHPPSPTSRPSPSPSPTGAPRDPGTVAPTPVG